MVFVAYPPTGEPWARFDIAKYIEQFSDSRDGEDDGISLAELADEDPVTDDTEE